MWTKGYDLKSSFTPADVLDNGTTYFLYVCT